MRPLRQTKPRDSYIYIGCTEKFHHVGQTDDSFQLPDYGKTYYIFHQREYPREQKPKEGPRETAGNRQGRLTPDRDRLR